MEQTTFDLIWQGLIQQGPVVTLLGIAIYWLKKQNEKKDEVINGLYQLIISNNKETIEATAETAAELRRVADELKEIKQKM